MIYRPGESEQRDSSIALQSIRGSLFSVGASFITLVLGFLRSVLLARLLLPEHFGLVALALFYIGLVAQLRGLGLDTALIHRQDSDEPFMGTYFTLRIGLDLLAFGFLLASIPLLVQFYPHMPGLGGILLVLILAYMLSSLSQIQETLLRKNLAFSRLAMVDVVASLVMTISAPYLAWRGWGIWALVAEQVSGLTARFLLTWGPFRQWRPRLGWDRVERNWLWGYGKPVWVSANLGYLLDRFDDFWIGTALGNIALGYYSRAYEFAHYPRRVFANPLVSVFGPVFARLQGDRLQLSRAFYRSAHFILRTGFLIAGAFALVMPEFIHFVIGEKWLPMLWTFRLMLIYTALDPFLMLLGNLMLVVGQPGALQNSRLAQTAFFIPAVPLGAFLWEINGVALAADGMLLIGVWWLYRPMRGVVDFSLWRLLVWPAIALAFAWTGGLLVEQLVPGGTWQVLLLKLGTFLLLFGGFLVVVERGDYFKGARLFRTALRNSRGQAS